MQNKPNFQKSQMNANLYNTMDYEIFLPLAGQKNKPNSNPIKPNCLKAKMDVNLYVIEDYRKKEDFVVRINKPNFRNGQNERKLSFNKGLQKKRCVHRQKNKPKQTQFQNPIPTLRQAFFTHQRSTVDFPLGKPRISCILNDCYRGVVC